MSKEALTSQADLNGNGAAPNQAEKPETGSAKSQTDLIGRVASPPQLESTSETFHFWVQRDRLVERTQLVRAESFINGELIKFYGVVDEVHRRSRKRDIHEESDVLDGDVGNEPEFKPEGITYASVSILRTDRNVLTPPIEQSKVYLGGEAEAEVSYGFKDMKRPIAVGRLRNGGSNYAGLAKIDLAYLLGDNSGHMNVTGMPGAGTKSSFLMTIVRLLINEAQPKLGKKPLHIVPIVLNVKGEDLMWIDRPNSEFQEKREECQADWEILGVEPEPFEKVQFYTPTVPNSGGAPAIDGCKATAYNWSLSNVLAGELFPFLFSDDTISSVMLFLVNDIVAFLTTKDGKQLKPDAPKTWNELLQWMQEQAAKQDSDRAVKMHQLGTWRAVYRRLSDILTEGESIFLRDVHNGNPLRVTKTETSPPQVIDINKLPVSLQRFVVGAIFKQVVDARTGHSAVPGLRYLLVLDELNRFAPRNSTDPITKLLERVATELRSQGVILLGAQQFASQVSTKIVESAAVRVLGRIGSAELQDKVWQGWDKSVRNQANSLQPEEKLIMQATFRQPMFVKLPFPSWAMRREDIAAKPLDQTPEI